MFILISSVHNFFRAMMFAFIISNDVYHNFVVLLVSIAFYIVKLFKYEIHVFSSRVYV